GRVGLGGSAEIRPRDPGETGLPGGEIARERLVLRRLAGPHHEHAPSLSAGSDTFPPRRQPQFVATCFARKLRRVRCAPCTAFSSASTCSPGSMLTFHVWRDVSTVAPPDTMLRMLPLAFDTVSLTSHVTSIHGPFSCRLRRVIDPSTTNRCRRAPAPGS